MNVLHPSCARPPRWSPPHYSDTEETGRSLHLSFATRRRTQRSLDLRLVDSVNSKPRESAAQHQRPDCVSRQRIRIETETTKSRKVKRSPYSIAERRVPELIPVLGSQPAGDVSHTPGGRPPLLSAKPAVTLATLKRAATNLAAW